MRHGYDTFAFVPTQPAFTSSKLTIETLEQVVKDVQINNKDTKVSFWCLYYHTLFHNEHISHPVLVFILFPLSR